MLFKSPTNLSAHLGQKLLRSYLNSGDLAAARQLFDKIPEPNLHCWTYLISAYTTHGFANEAIKLYSLFRKRNIQVPDRVVLLSAAKACAAYTDLTRAKEIHEDSVRLGFQSDLLLGNALIDMYGKCKCHRGAQRVFDEMPVKDVISWTSLLSCYVNCGLHREALVVFSEMGINGVGPNAVTLSSIIPACLKCLDSGRQIHGYVVKNGFSENAFVTSALVDMYSSCSYLRQAQLVFDSMVVRDIVSWNVILSAHFVNGESEKALSIFNDMRTQGGVCLNYDSWNTVIGGCMQSGNHSQALELLVGMQRNGFKPNQITITSALPACSNLENLRKGKEIHGYIFRNVIFDDMATTTALIYMYAKCGKLELSRWIFDRMPRKDNIAWNTMIIAHSMHGDGEEALSLFKTMIKYGVKPNSVTFTGVLSGCSHSRLVDEGLQIVHSMSKDHFVEPDVDHYSSLIDMLSRSGRLQDAYGYIQRMPMEPNAGAWGALLGGCRVYKNVELARIAAKQLFEIEPENPGNYVLLSNIFVAAKIWGEASQTRKLMENKGISKLPGCSWIQVQNRVYTFVVGDKRNEHSDKIYKFLSEMGDNVRLAGYLPNTDFVLQDLDQEEKEEVLCNHSEKLAVAFGLLNLTGESSIRVFKNLRICGDCHNFIKFTAKVVGIQIIVRDSLRFHHFKDGLCSCGDFW